LVYILDISLISINKVS